MAGMMTGQPVPPRTSARDDEERRMMQMMEQIQQGRAPNSAVAMTPQAQQQMQNFEAARAQAMQPARSVSKGSTTARPEKAGLLSRLGRGALDALQDPVRQSQIVTALNSMRLNPDPNLAKSMQTRAAGVQASRQQAQQQTQKENLQKQKTNRTVEYLKSINRLDLAQAVELNPQMANEVLKLALSPTKGVVLGKDQRYIDPQTGQVIFGAEEQDGLTEEQRKNLTDLRKEYVGLPATKDFAKQATAYDRVVKSADDPSAAGDLSLIFNFMKVLDPGSVVRESEFATAAGARAALTRAEGQGTPIPAIVAQALQRLETGQLLLPDQRQDFVSRAGMLYTGAEEMHQRLRSYYEGESLKVSPTATLPSFGFFGEVFKVGENTATPDLVIPPPDWTLGKDAWDALSAEDRKAYLEDNDNG